MLKKLWHWLFGSRHHEQAQPASPSSCYSPMTKYYIFNETGNIMLCATSDSIHSFDEDVKTAFIDITVFFSAMTKALASTTNPATGRPFSIYNYLAVKNILLNSSLFIETNVEERFIESSAVGESLGKELLQTALNRNFSEAKLGFTRGMFNAMGYQSTCANTGKKPAANQSALCQSGSVFFICELLMGLPQTSAVLISIEPYSGKVKGDNGDATLSTFEQEDDKQDIFLLGRKQEQRHKHQGNKRTWKFKKRSYLFVSPKFLSNNVASLGESGSQEFKEMVETMAQGLQTLANNPTS